MLVRVFSGKFLELKVRAVSCVDLGFVACAVRYGPGYTNGRIICLSTPYGKRGFFYDAWTRGGDDWMRIEAPVQQISRISPQFLACQRRTMASLRSMC